MSETADDAPEKPRETSSSFSSSPTLALAAGAIALSAGAAVAFGGLAEPWLVAAGSAAIGALATTLAGARSASRRHEVPVTVVPPPRSEPDGAQLLRLRAVEVRSAERTSLLDALGDAVLLVDAHGETRFANAAARSLLGDDAGTPGTRAAIERLPAQVLRAVGGITAGATAAGGRARRRIECEVEVHGADGRSQDDVPAVVYVARVVGEREPLAAIVVRDVRAEREADRMKSEFVAKASHELRTPLSALRAYAEMLADGEVADARQASEFARIILAETSRLGALVDRMLDIGRIESGMARAQHEPTDLAALIEECVAEQRSEAQRRSIDLRVVRAAAGATASADRALMKQVVLNLLSNALKYTPDGGRVSVESDIDSLARSVVVSVRDTGIGIPPHALPRLFGKFYRVENHEKVAKGTGLGLNLCRSIVEGMHGGQIGVESTPGEGSRFWFAIPIEQVGRKAA